ncbi:flagellar basal body L-ring protein FlgH [Dechloromonas sp. ZS-1]|uniref:flagellar basal body L-ring protein FlgH n=1 Tax=Dechloromonas sp. ZS-1 TaxID=3138067 RepID=UPI0031FC54F3
MKRFIMLSLVICAGCTTVPPTNVHQPMSVRPVPRAEFGAANGAIFQTGGARPLFEDRRARYVGDTMTITITENTSATATNNNKLDRTNTNNFAVNTLSGLPGKSTLGASLNTQNTVAFEGKGAASNTNAFTGSITVTVIDVLPNGNLLVSGEKQLSVGNEQEFVRLSGVVNPSFVDASNTIASSKVADARIEYKSAGQMAEGMSMAWLGRFFMNVLPF